MALVLVTAPAIEPVALDSVKDHLRIDTDDEDLLLEQVIRAARLNVESHMRRAIVAQTWRLTMDRFEPIVRLPMGHTIAVDHVKYVDETGALQTLSASLYAVDTDTEPARLRPAYGESWPTVRDDIDVIEIQYQAGYGTLRTDIPYPISAALLLMAGHLYENREASSLVTLSQIPFGVRALCAPYQAHWF